MSADDEIQKDVQPSQDISVNQLYALLLEANEKQTEVLKAELQSNIKIVTNKIEENNKEVENLKKKCIYLERRNRKNNIVIFGIKEPQANQNLLKNTLKLINELLETNIKEEDINNVYTLGNRNDSPIMLEFISFLKKITLFQNTENLRNLKAKGISIANDLCPEDREDRKTLQKHLNHAKAQNLEASIKGFRLQINNKLFTVEDLKKIERNAYSDIDSSVKSDSGESSEGEVEEKEFAAVESNQHTASSSQGLNIVRRPLVQNKPTASKRKRSKVYKYSPKKHSEIRITRSQIKDK